MPGAGRPVGGRAFLRCLPYVKLSSAHPQWRGRWWALVLARWVCQPVGGRSGFSSFVEGETGSFSRKVLLPPSLSLWDVPTSLGFLTPSHPMSHGGKTTLAVVWNLRAQALVASGEPSCSRSRRLPAMWEPLGCFRREFHCDTEDHLLRADSPCLQSLVKPNVWRCTSCFTGSADD